MEGPPHEVFRGRFASSRIIHCGDGYYYNIKEERRSRYRLKCRHYQSGGRGCTATASLCKASGVLKHLNPHNHGPDHDLEEDFVVRDAMINEARTDVAGKKIRRIIDETKLRLAYLQTHILKVNREVFFYLCLFSLFCSLRNPRLARRFTRSRMCSSLYKARSENYPRIPVTLLFLGVLLGSPGLAAVCKTIDGADYIFRGFIGCVQQKTSALVFVSGRMLQFLQTRESIHVDGTFKKRPKKPKINQIFNIVVKYCGHVSAVWSCNLGNEHRLQRMYMTSPLCCR